MSSPQAYNLIKSNNREASETDPQAMPSPPSIRHVTTNSPQPEFATMTNVNVLDLHKEYATDKDSAGGSIQYIYTAGPPPKSAHNDNSNAKIENDQMVNGIVQRITPNGQVIDANIPHDLRQPPPPPPPPSSQSQQITNGMPVEQLFEKMGLSDEQILRLLGSNGENIQIISREIIDGEPHIITRMENGEHVMTRIVTADPKLSAVDTNAIYTTIANESIDANDSDIVYTTTGPNHITTSVLQYGDASGAVVGGIKGAIHQQSYSHASVTGSVITTTAPAVMVDENGTTSAANANKAKSHIIYSTGETVIKEEEIYAADKVPIYTTTASNDLIYEDGGKTVIYTTTSDPKGLELYSGNDISLINSDGQVIVQGGLQYTTQQINGQTVFVLSEPPLENEIAPTASHQR